MESRATVLDHDHVKVAGIRVPHGGVDAVVGCHTSYKENLMPAILSATSSVVS